MPLLFDTAMTQASVQSTVDANTLPDVNFDNMEQLWFTNYIDHNDLSAGTYQQRYWVDNEYWTDPSGPNFIYFCGEYTCSPPADRHFPFQVGANKNARLFVIEHRFYGQSQPCVDWSLECYNGLLTSEQGLADFGYFLTTMDEDMPSRQTIVIGGSYPGALSAWFRYTYPEIATASWAASAVVQPWEDMWTYDEQIYTSLNNIDWWCADLIAQVANYSAEQGILRNNGQPNAIDDILAGTSSAGMTTDDFENYIADFPAGHVQYGGSKDFCAEIDPLRELPISEAFTVLINAEIAAGNTPDYYDSTPSSQIMQTTIDFNYSGRSWTY